MNEKALDIIEAIQRADTAGVMIVEVSMKDLLALVDCIEGLSEEVGLLECEILTLQDKVKRLNISLAKAELCALEKPLRLDTFA